MGDFEEIPLSLPLTDLDEDESSAATEPNLDNHNNGSLPSAVKLQQHSGRAYAAEPTWQATITSASKLPLHSGAVVVYTVETVIDGKTHVVSHRYSHFEQLDASVREYYRRYHQQFISNIPPLASKAWAWKDQHSREFISARRDALQEYMDRVLGLPHAIECPAIRDFLISTPNH